MNAVDPYDRSILEASPERVADLLTRLARAAADFPRGRSARRLRRLSHDHLDQLAEPLALVASEAGEPMAGILAQAVRRSSDPAVARRIAATMTEPYPAVAELGIACWTIITRATLGDADPSRDGFALRVAEDVAELVVWQGSAGRAGAAVAVIRRALALLRRHGLPLPLGLMCQHAGMLISLGRLDEAERRLRKVLAQADAQGVDPLAMAEEWINLANVRHTQGDADEALEVSRHALHLLLRGRIHSEERSDLLPGAMTNHALYLLDCGRPRAAAAAIGHVLRVVGRQADRAPDLHRPALIKALINASAIYAALGAMEDARTCSSRAVAHVRQLGGSAALAHGVGHVRGLINHAIDMENMGDAGFATEMARAAVAVARDLRSRHGAAFLEVEVDALVTLCHAGLHADLLAEAREAGEAALDLVEHLPPSVRRERLLELLPNLADVHGRLDETETALGLARQAYTLLREQEGIGGVALEIRTGIRDVYAKYLSDHGDTAGALAVIHEAVEIARSALADSPDLVSVAPAHSLIHLSGNLADLGDLDGALDAARQGVEMVRALGRYSRDWAESQLSVALHTQARVHWLRGELAEARELAAELVSLARRGVETDRRSHLGELASALEFSAVIANASDDLANAVASIGEAVALYRELVGEVGAGHGDDLANGLHNAATIALAAGAVEDAIAFQTEADEVFSGLPSPSPSILKLAADGLCNLGVYLAMVERVEEGLAALGRAQLLIQELPDDWRPGLETSIGARVAKSRLLVLAGRHAEAAEICGTALADMDCLGFDFWRGPALNALAMALAALGDPSASGMARTAFDFHRNQLEAEGASEGIHGLCDAAAVLIDVEPGSLEGILDVVAPWLERLSPARLSFAAGELARALSEARPQSSGRHAVLIERLGMGG